MLFTTDKQTLDDLNIFGKQGAGAIYHLFNRCCTRGGAAALEEMFRYPLSDELAINQRVDIFRQFAAAGISFPFDPALFDGIEAYLANTDQRTKLTGREPSMGQKLGRIITVDNETALLYRGVQHLVTLLQAVRSFACAPAHKNDRAYVAERDALRALVDDAVLTPVLAHQGKLTHATMSRFDDLLRFRHRDVVQRLLRRLYLLDVYISIAGVAVARDLAFPRALPRDRHLVRLAGVYHPQVPHAVSNDITIAPDSHIVFLTGANMAGKSTFMKSLGIAVFLAHMGFPVPAGEMEFSVMDGIYTTINLPDNLGMGASHFYAEVLRVKKIASELRQGKRLFVVFDELFRGTNVKDAYDATIDVTKGFARKNTSSFIISTHIIEAGEALKKVCSGIQYLFLPTGMQGHHPVYTYRLEHGITDDRHGMIIIDNEGILRMLDGNPPGRPHGQGFIADRQTLEDLNLLGRFRPHSIFNIFNKVRTGGGQRWLDELFQHPMTDAAAINRRSDTFRYFQALRLTFPFRHETFLPAENYLGSDTACHSIVSAGHILYKKITGVFLRDDRYAQLLAGLRAAIDVLNTLKDLLDKIDIPLVQEAKAILHDRRLSWLSGEKGMQHLAWWKVSKYHRLLRHTLREEMAAVLQCVYQLDVFIGVSEVACERNLSYAHALPAAENCIEASALWHPAIDNAVANPLAPGDGSNLIFLTGANMAGKSTFMKSFGIALYLAHMGFPLAARDMRFSVRDGLYSSINVADNLNLGHSHFYAEVLRVKTVAAQVSEGRNIVVIFDELFKGTNVKDAYDATLQITTAFTNYRNCFFMISTHIIEVGEALREKGAAVRFVYLPTVMEGAVPRYTYLLTEGITGDRHGMMIIDNEKILEILA